MVGGWWFFNNYKNLGIGGGGSSAPAGGEVPPLEEGGAVPTPVPQTTEEYYGPRGETDIRKAFEQAHNLPYEPKCVGGTSNGKASYSKCECLKAGGKTAVVCTRHEGHRCLVKCPVSSILAKDFKSAKGCKCDWPPRTTAAAAAAYISASTYTEYAHGFPRTKLPRAMDVVIENP